MSPHISVVIPVYMAEGCLDALHRRLVTALETITPSFEIILVEDRGHDNSWQIITRIALDDRRVTALRLSRNFGQQAAITAGLAHARGDWTVVMDCDLQDRPEEIPRLYAAARSGFDIVMSRRTQRTDSLWRRIGNRFYFRMMKVFTGAQFDRSLATLSMISRNVREALLDFNDQDRHYFLMLSWLGFSTTAIDVEHAPRHAGESSYTLRALIRHAISGVVFSTTKLLRWIVYIGFAQSAIGAFAVVWLVVERFNQQTVPGWTSIVATILLTGGMIMTSTGIAALYIGKMFEQVKGRPLYVVDERVGGSTGSADVNPVASTDWIVADERSYVQ